MSADPAKDQEYLAEAERLAQLPRDVQRQIVAITRSPADNPKLGRADREAARERADAVERHLRRLNRRKNDP